MKEIKVGRERQLKGISVEATNKEINDYIIFKITEYIHYNFQDDELQELYQEDFKGFFIATFKDCNQLGIRKLRVLLQSNSVQVRKDRYKTVAESLYNILQEEEPTKQTIQEIQEYIRTIGRFNSVQINYILSQNDTVSSIYARTAVPDLPDLPDPLDPSDFPDPYQHIQSASKELERPASREQSFSKELANLAKIYMDKSRYSGENDNFDYKLVIFYNLCSRADIPDDIKAKAYLTIL